MSGFIDKLGLNEIISKVSIYTKSDNLEDIYMELDERSKNEPDCSAVKNQLEKVIRSYIRIARWTYYLWFFGYEFDEQGLDCHI